MHALHAGDRPNIVEEETSFGIIVKESANDDVVEDVTVVVRIVIVIVIIVMEYATLPIDEHDFTIAILGIIWSSNQKIAIESNLAFIRIPLFEA